MKWITREGVKVHRVACPWLLRRFIDPQPQFIFVPSDKVMQVAAQEGATPFDEQRVELGHHGKERTFDALVKKYNLYCCPTISLLLLLLPVIVIGCANQQTTGRGWGQDATYHPSLARIKDAAWRAATDWETLVPLGVAGAVAAGDMDRRTSTWAIQHHPVFGSESNATSASDYLVYTLLAETAVTATLTPQGDDQDPLLSKAEGLMVEGLALGGTEGVTEATKALAQRRRPEGNSNTSFFSSHASDAFANATLSNRNLDSIGLSDGAQAATYSANLLLATGAAWARVEGGHHFPTDVLVGAAVGHFISAFVYDAFLGLPENSRVHFGISPLGKGAEIWMKLDF